MRVRRVPQFPLAHAASGAIAVALLAGLAACGGKDNTGPGTITPTRLAFAAQPDSGLVGDTLALGTTAVDASGRVATDPRIAYTYASSDTTVVRVSAGGVLRYVGPGAASVTARATGVPGGAALSLATAPLVSLVPPARVRVLPSRIDAAPNTAVALAVLVYDSAGNRISYPATSTSDNAAVASTTAASTSVRVAAPGSATVTVRADFRGRGVSTTVPVAAAAITPGPFTIDVRPFGPTNPAYANLFTQAAAFWRGVITAPLPSVDVNVPADSCGGPAVQTTTTGVVILFTVDSIDGPGSILGAAGPCVQRADAAGGQHGLTAVGTMVFDSADIGRLVSQGRAYDVIRHEMGHVLGIGTLWNADGVRTDFLGNGTSEPQYVGGSGEAASAVLGFTGPGGPVPVENVGGRGTYGSHWRTSVFGAELMTGYLAAGTSHPASRLTILSLADLGYQVNIAASEPILPGPSVLALRAARAAAAEPAGDRFRDVALRPLFALRPEGGLRRLRTPAPFEATLRRGAHR